jgi:O-antigen ligase
MIKKYISHIVIILTMLNIPSIVLHTQTIELSSPISYLIFFLLGILIYTNKTKFPKKILFLAGISSLYYFIGALQYEGDFIILIIEYVKFLITLFGLFISLRYVNQKTIILILLTGAITILLDSIYFRFNDFQGIGYVSEYGRYSGFYLNPNIAAIICLFGYGLTITKKNRWKILSIFFTFLGFLTLSKTYIISWILITFIYLFYNRKSLVKIFFIFICAFFGLLTLSEKLNLDAQRFEFISNIFSGKVDNKFLMDDSRQSQWLLFTDKIYDSPIIGNGYGSFSSSLGNINNSGVHNSFLLILGEAGILPFLLITSLFFFLLKKSYNLREKNLSVMLLTSILLIQFLVSHNFFDSGLILFILLNIIYLSYKNDEKK